MNTTPLDQSVPHPTVGELSRSQIDLIKPLWEELNLIHFHDSTHFKDHYQRFTFEERCRAFEKLGDEDFKIFVGKEGEQICGYALASINDGDGEIQSLMVASVHRGRGLGTDLVQACQNWFTHRGCGRVRVTVAQGHEAVFDFYQRLGFFPRLTVLEFKGTPGPTEP